MNTSSPVQNDWKDLYRAALFECNQNIPIRIPEAEKRIEERARELSTQEPKLRSKAAP
jgi:hypothetical protein